MKKQLQEIPSDTTIEAIHANGDELLVHLTLYTEENITLNFQQVLGHRAVAWDKDEAVEGLLLCANSEFLKDSMKRLEDLKIPNSEGIKSFQFTSIDGVLLEVLAVKLSIGGKTYGD